MHDLAIYIGNVLHSLDQDVAPIAGTDPQASAALRAIRQILTRLMVNQPRGALITGDTSPASAAPHFGGMAAHRADEMEAIRLFLDGGGSLSAPLIRKEGDIISGLDRLVADRLADHGDRTALPAGKDGDMRGRLEAFIRTHFGCPEARITDYRELLGGRSKITALLKVDACPALPMDIVMRRDASINMTGGVSVVQEFPVLHLVHQNAVPVPAPLALCADTDIVGSPFMLMQRVRR